MIRLLAVSLLCAGCSLAFPMSEYDEGSGSGGAGGQLDCGTFSHPPISSIRNSFDVELGSDLAFLDECGAVVDGKLVFDPMVANDFCWVYNVTEHHLTCDALTLRLIDAGSQLAGMQRFIYLNRFDADERVFVLQEINGFNFDFLEEVDGSFHPVEDAWWRLRADRDALFFETSSDGAAWSLKGSGPHTFSLDSVRVQFGAGLWQEIAEPLPVSYDCLNVPPPCP